MKNITVEYTQSKCIGATKCVEVFPEYFLFDGEKASLLGAAEKAGVQTLALACAPKQVELFVEAAERCPVNAIKVVDNDTSTVLVSTEVEQKSGMKVIHAEYDDLTEFVMDPLGYFLIRVDKEQGIIEVGLCRELNKVAVKVVGKKPLDIYQTIIKLGLVSRLDHAAYLGRELQKAYIALQKGIPYVQDDELNL